MSDICPTCHVEYDFDYVYDTKGDFVRVKMCECGEFPIEVITPEWLDSQIDRFTEWYTKCPNCAKPAVIEFTEFMTSDPVVQCNAVFMCCKHTEHLTIMRPRKGKKD